MKANDIKKQMMLRRFYKHYGSTSEKTEKNWQCVFLQKHHNEDRYPSVMFSDEKAIYHSQWCFNGASVVEIVELVEGLARFSKG